MKKLAILTVAIATLISCSKNPEELLTEAQNKFYKNQISYITEAHFPVPDTKLVNKTFYETSLLFDETDDLGYQFVQKSDDKDIIYDNSELKVLYHNDKKTQILQPKHFNDNNQFVNVSDGQFIRKRWSPLGLLKHDWEFKQDSLIDKVNHKNFSRVVYDTVLEGKAIRTEQHIFINPDALLTRFERRNFQDNVNSQTLTFIYSDYKFNKTSKQLSYSIPSSYVTQYGIIRKDVKKVNEGDIATSFEAKSMDGQLINTAKYKGQKYILNFSVINCGNCKASLDYINQDSYTYNKDIPMLYINPEDTDDMMKTYREDINIDFPVITNAAEIAADYGVTSFPRFFVIDESGKIEKIVIGHSKEFLDELSI